jgi:replicative DNA helicase
MKTGQLTPDQRQACQRARDTFDAWGANLVLSTARRLSLDQLRQRARRAQREYDVDMVIVDSLQKLYLPGFGGTKSQKIDRTADALKTLARELDIPVLVTCHLSRACEARPDKRPVLGDLGEADGLAQEADVVMFLCRDGYDYPDARQEGRAELIVVKHRTGPNGVVEMRFCKACARFTDRGGSEEAPWNRDAGGKGLAG